MDSKVGIFVIIGALLVLAAYSSAMYFGYAFTSCTYNKDKTQSQCSHIDEDGDHTTWNCEKNADGKTWNCKQAKSEPSSEDSEAFALNDALDTAIGESQNTRKVPKSGLNDGDLLTEGGQSNNNTKVPKDLPGLNDDDGGPAINPGLQ